jgi:hypothetical protein
MTTSIRLPLEPVIRILRNILSLAKWEYNLYVTSTAYCLEVKSPTDTCYFKIPELLFCSNLSCNIPLECIQAIAAIPLKGVAGLHCTIEYKDDNTYIFSIDTSEVSFELVKIEDLVIDEQLQEKEEEIENISSLFSMIQDAGGNRYGLFISSQTFLLPSRDLSSCFLSVSSAKSTDLRCIKEVNFLYAVLGKFSLHEDKLSFFKTKVEESKVLYGTFVIKSNRRVLAEVEVLYLTTPAITDTDSEISAKLLEQYDTSLKVEAITLSKTKLEEQLKYIKNNELDNSDLVFLTRGKKIAVKDLQYLYNNLDKSKLIFHDDKILCSMIQYDYLFTLHTEKLAEEKTITED